MDSLLPILPYIQISLAVILIGAILMQQRGAGLGGAFGGGEGTIHYERRGAEKTLFKATVVVAILFVVATGVQLFVNTPSTSLEVPITDTDSTLETPPIDIESIKVGSENGDVSTIDAEAITTESIPVETAGTPAN